MKIVEYRVLEIGVSSNSSVDWVKREASAFGPINYLPNRKLIRLNINQEYLAIEVRRYLLERWHEEMAE